MCVCVFMKGKRNALFLSILIIFISVIGAYASEYDSEYGDFNFLFDETDESGMFGCCSIACQLDGNESVFAFRRDSPHAADIKIEKINWHGKEAIKQWKEEGGYFCQAIITNDGWTIGYGGLDDGEVSQQIENITGQMVENNKIDNATLEKIQDMKKPYGRGHVLIKTPDGDYGVAMATTHFTGKLKPGDYISIPNKPEYVRTGDIQMNSSDKVKILHKLEMSDGYGIERRDITTFFFHHFENETFKGNITDIAVSNDDGSQFGMKTAQSVDNIIFNGTTLKKEDIPIGPTYKELGKVDFLTEKQNNNFGLGFLLYIAIIIFVVALFVIIIRKINKIRYKRKRKRIEKQYRNLYLDDRYR